MIGVFDSGVGGMTAFDELRRLLPCEDMVYLADRSNAPYGTKSERELVFLVREDIRRLRELGCEKILVACCTASTVVSLLSEAERRICTPIILPTARAAVSSAISRAATPKSGKSPDGISKLPAHIAVIATEHTAGTQAFGEAIKSEWSKCKDWRYPPPCVTEIATQALVYEVEGGSRDGRISESCGRFLSEIAKEISKLGADTLILGCTHFSHLEGELSARLPSVRVISAAREGARALYKSLLKEGHRPPERGKTVYL